MKIEGGTALRCDICGEQIGKYFGTKPDPAVVVCRCYACSTEEEANAITASAPTDRNDGSSS